MLACATSAFAEDGYDLWLRYRAIEAPAAAAYRAQATAIVAPAPASPTLAAARDELQRGLSGMLGSEIPIAARADGAGAIVLGTPANAPAVAALHLDLSRLGRDGYLIRSVTLS